MSSNLPESDSFPAAIIWPEIPDNNYPSTTQTGAGNLASRTRHIQNTLTGNIAAGQDLALYATSTEERVENWPHPVSRLGADNLFTGLTLRTLKSIKWIAQRVPGLRSGTQILSYAPIITQNTTTPPWATTIAASGTIPVARQDDNSANGAAWFELPALPRAGRITQVSVRVVGDPTASHAGLPANMPRGQLIRYIPAATATGLGTATLADQVDTSANLTAYRAAHTIVMSGLSEDLYTSPALFFRVRVVGEYGTNSEPGGLYVTGIDVTITGAS